MAGRRSGEHVTYAEVKTEKTVPSSWIIGGQKESDRVVYSDVIEVKSQPQRSDADAVKSAATSSLTVPKVSYSLASPGPRMLLLLEGAKATIIGRELIKSSIEEPIVDPRSPSGNRRTHYIRYTIQIESRFPPSDMPPWTVKRRYRQFYQLQQDLQKATDSAKVLRLAPKRYIKNNLSEQFLNQRQDMLKLYLDALLGINVLVRHPVTLSFLEAS